MTHVNSLVDGDWHLNHLDGTSIMISSSAYSFASPCLRSVAKRTQTPIHRPGHTATLLIKRLLNMGLEESALLNYLR